MSAIGKKGVTRSGLVEGATVPKQMFRLGFHDSESVAYLFLMDLQNVELALKPILRG